MFYVLTLQSEEIFLDMFEEEYTERKKGPLNVEWLMMDSNVLLPPTGTPMTGIEFSKRLPCGEVKREVDMLFAFILLHDNSGHVFKIIILSGTVLCFLKVRNYQLGIKLLNYS